jgi:hypothetical protein
MKFPLWLSLFFILVYFTSISLSREDYEIYPASSVTNNFDYSTASMKANNDISTKTDTDINHTLSFIQTASKIHNFIGYGTVAYLSFNMAMKMLLNVCSRSMKEPSLLTPTYIRFENDTIKEILSEHEELWNAILNIHNKHI